MTSKRATCVRRQVGCILVDKDWYVLATGFNGVPSGLPHCNDPGNISKLRAVPSDDGNELTNFSFPNACPGAFAESGTNLDGCHAIHAEQNALLRCRDPREIFACYATASPCMTCVKLLMNTGCRQIYFLEPYAHDEPARELWESLRGKGAWIHLTPELEAQLREHGQ